MLNDQQRAAAEHWNRMAEAKPLRLRWWDSPTLTELVNRQFAAITGSASAAELITRQSGVKKFRRAISVGCGTAAEELSLLKLGFVEKFVLCDFSASQLSLARETAVSMGIDPGRLTFHTSVNMAEPYPEDVDLVYWRQSLHHMLDTNAAIAWSAATVRGAGVIYCNDYCGPNRLQWTPEMIDWIERARLSLPSDYLRSPFNPSEFLPARVEPLSVEEWLTIDPTECADSERILPSLRRHAPRSTVFHLGGLIYHIALADIIFNFDDDRDAWRLDRLMRMDRRLAERRVPHYFSSVSTFPAGWWPRLRGRVGLTR